MVRRAHGRHCAQANRDASAATSRGECTRRNTTEKTGQTWCKGEVWPIDGSLLMGDVPILLQSTMAEVKLVLRWWLSVMGDTGGTSGGTVV